MEYISVIKGKFIERPNRFVAYVDVDGERLKCHVKNTGRCRELLIPGAEVILEKAQNPERKTGYSLVAVYKGQILINMDSQAPNKVVGEALNLGKIFGDIKSFRAEFKYASSRFDFYTESLEERRLIEVKGVTLERDGVALFPDAPTERGVKHLNELAVAVSGGFSTAVIFVIQMEGIKYFTPNTVMHPQFTEALKNAKEAGTEVLAFDCRVTESTMELGEPIPVKI